MPSADDIPAPTSASSATPGRSPWLGKLSQREFEIDFYERILSGQPNDVRLLRLLGELYAREGQHQQALEIDCKLVELEPESPAIRYNFACSLAMQGKRRLALEELDRALALGYNELDHLEVDPDLESLRSLPEFAALLRKYGLSAS